MVLGGGVFERWLGHEDVALMNEINAFIKETQKQKQNKQTKRLALGLPWQSSG